MPKSNINPNLGGSLATVAGERALAELEAFLNQSKKSEKHPEGKLGKLREATRALGRAIVENTQPSEERTNALNDLQKVFTYAKIAAFR
jgi:hypothetical protein